MVRNGLHPVGVCLFSRFRGEDGRGGRCPQESQAMNRVRLSMAHQSKLLSIMSHGSEVETLPSNDGVSLT